MKKFYLVMTLLVCVLVAVGCGQSAKTPTPAADQPAPTEKAAAPAPEAAPAEEAPAPAAAEAAPAEEGSAPAAAAPAEAAHAEAAPAEAAHAEAAPAAEPEAAAEPVADGKPKIVVDRPEYNFGQSDNSETINCEFILRNAGSAVLNIENVRASCGCTTTDLPKKNIEPGEEVALQAALNLRGRQGQQTKAITVTSNDPETPTLQLRITGEAVASISIDPMAVQLGRIEDDNPREKTVIIQSNKPEITFKVISVELDGIDFITHEIKEVEPGRKWELSMKTDANLPEGNHNGRFVIRTDSAERAVLWLPVSLQVVGALQIAPPVVNIRISEDPTEVEQQTLSITGGRSAEFKIEEVIVPLDDIQSELIEAGPNAYRLRLSNMPKTDALEDQFVTLKTNLPNSPEVKIPFNLYQPRLRGITPKTQAVQRPPANVPDVADVPAAQSDDAAE